MTSRFEAAPSPRTAPLGIGRTAEVYAWQPGWIVKLFFEHVPRRYVEMEARVARAVHAAAHHAPFSVPAVGEIVVAGTRIGLRYACAQGEALQRACARDDMRPLSACIGERLAELHLAIHRHRVDSHVNRSLDALPDQRQRLKLAIHTAEVLPDEHRLTLLRELQREWQRMSGPDAHNLCHGDFHPYNVLQDANGAATVIDWACAEIGSALCDVAKTSLRLRFAPVTRTARLTAAQTAMRCDVNRAYLRRYFADDVNRQRRVEYERWLPLAAAARLVEGVGATERAALLAFIECRLAREAVDLT